MGLDSKVGVIGGSIAGCAAYTALSRAGCDVHVFERSSGALRDRGSGIAIPVPLRDELVAAGYLPADYACCPLERRWWVIADGSPGGRRLWEQPGAAVTNNWGLLWRNLRGNVPDERYHDGCSVDSILDVEHGVAVTFADGTTEWFDAVVGADGYRSTVREHLHPGSAPEYAGYVLWRGNYEESRVANRAPIERADASNAWHTVVFEGGHGVVYMIPDFDDRSDPGRRRVNWAVYAPQPPGLGFEEPTSVPPGDVTPDLYSHLDRILSADFPPELEALIRLSPVDEVSIQPIYDEQVDRFVGGRVLLIGDAGTVTRPHTGSGATKALQDALALERLAADAADLAGLLDAYDSERVASGMSLVEIGRRIGHAQVEATPDWGSMTPADFEAWTAATLAGEKLYLYENLDD
jgi:2-polyprenyl-6-methoxyphenol hydroxylase-like FAD-dependent oxidoreductase